MAIDLKNKSLLSRHGGQVPRYTSYPTAPHFHSGIGCDNYAQWLSELEPGQQLSLYLHIPYCDRLCWFCACHTKQTLRYQPITTYLQALFREIETVSRLVPADSQVKAVHLGGGSPTMLKPEDMIGLIGRLKAAFRFASDVEISVEMDPNDMDEARYDALATIGMTRASLGVQDFDPQVQKAINRIQTFEQTKSVVDSVRSRGIGSVNCDLLYGLPYQTLEGLERTVGDILSLDPDRIALFGYAHVPWMKKHQQMIPSDALPNAQARFEQMQSAAGLLTSAGYQQIGIDHFAKPDDGLAVALRKGQLKRNFQGYTDDANGALIGLGASAIGRLPQGYVQNMPATGEYQRMAESGAPCVVRGVALSDDDRMRRDVIEQVMCEFHIDFSRLRAKWGAAADPLIAEARRLAAGEGADLVTLQGDAMRVREDARAFARSVAAAFDSYLHTGKGRHSIAV